MAVAQAISVPTRAPGQRISIGAQRLDYLDALKVALTTLVIAHHAGQPYGPTGGRWPIFDAERAAVLGPFFSVNAAFFMGLFFMISAYFLPSSLDRKGTWTFLKDRFVRLGIPFVIVGLTIGALSGSTFDPAHTWFLAHLLVYAVLYSTWRVLGLPGPRLPVPGHRAILVYAFLLASATAMVRMAGFPQDRWVAFVGVIPLEVAHLPQYASLFAIGLLARRGRWLSEFPTGTGMVWLAVGLSLSIARYLYSAAIGGGPHPMLWSVWESFICVGLCAGLPVLFREHLSRPGRLRAIAPNAYGAYVVHVLPVVVGLQFALAQVSVDPLTKFALVTLTGVPLSFLVAAALRRLPGTRAVV
jgi:surface polysaccharide O-acyltransferase-like enzyme